MPALQASLPKGGRETREQGGRLLDLLERLPGSGVLLVSQAVHLSFEFFQFFCIGGRLDGGVGAVFDAYNRSRGALQLGHDQPAHSEQGQQ